MSKYQFTDDTICAQATPSGHGGISVIRVSGPQSFEICKPLIKMPESLKTHQAFFSSVTSPGGGLIDEAVITYFAKDRSYTGDETFEISCHGSPAITEEIVQTLIQAGCRHAEKGEFTFRAFMSGKIDLLQAESVLTLIESETKKAAEVSLRQLKGELSKKIRHAKDETLLLLAHLEAGMDFAQEGLETITENQILNKIGDIKKQISDLVDSYAEGKILTEQFSVVLIGEPNVGKSSLFNALIRSDKAIVTEIAGTTRDAIESSVMVEGVKIKFVDTAGLRITDDIVEKIGIQKTHEQIQNADLIFYVIDATDKKSVLEKSLLEKYKNKIVIVANKIDRPEFDQNLTQKMLKDCDTHVFFLSAHQSESLSSVMTFLGDKLKKSFHETSAVVLKFRQYEILNKVKDCLSRAEDICRKEESREFAAFELRDSLEGLMDLLGERFDDQVLEKVFQEFCIGK